MPLWDELRPLQRRAVAFVCKQQESLLLFQQRLGKTWIALGAIERLHPVLTLIVCPLANKDTTWEDLIRAKLPDVPLLVFKKKVKRELVKAFKRGIVLLHFESLPGIIKWLRKIKWDFVIVDELHRGKDRASLTSRCLSKLRHVPRKLGLTGTPLDEEPADLWAQLRFVAPHIFGMRWLDFDEEYMEQPDINLDERKDDGSPRYPKGSIRWRRALIKRAIAKKQCKFRMEKLPQFIEAVRDICWREELPSPEPNFVFEWVKLYGDQKRVYDELSRKGVTRIGRTRIMATMTLTKREKLNQICGGYVIDDDGKTHRIGGVKQARLKSIIRHRGSPAVIFCRYTAEVSAISRELSGRVGVLSGAVKDRSIRAGTIRKFQNGKLDWIICQTRTGGVGIDLYRAKYLIVYSTTYSLIDFDQLVARIRLPEQTEPVTIILILATGTVDEDKHKRIYAKSSKVRGVLEPLKRGVTNVERQRVGRRRSGEGHGRRVGHRSRHSA